MILIVEDDSVILSLMQRALLRKGFQVDTAKDGLVALEKIRTNAYRGMILDMGLPSVDGETVLYVMKEEGITLPVLLIPGLRRLSDALLKEFPNVKGQVPKPFLMDDLVEAVLDCCREHGGESGGGSGRM